MVALTTSKLTAHTCGVQRPPRHTPVPALGATARRLVRQPIQARAAAAAPDTGLQRATKVRINTRSNCELSISVYPTFAYNAFGGGGEGTVEQRPDGTLFLRFNPSTLSIPDLSFRSTTMFGIPMPPPLNIAIQPLRLEGTLYPTTGEVALDFDAEFKFTLGSLYAAPSLLVNTALTTEFSAGRLKSATGQRLVGNSGTLVGVSNVPKTNDLFVDTFLLLPTDALAVLSCDFEFYP